MIGAIAGDIIGSIYEWNNIKFKDFPLFGADCTFTDDTVCTVAVADALMNSKDLASTLKSYVRRYPSRGYGGTFKDWALSYENMPPYNSWGNGSAMRVSSVPYLATSEDEVFELAEQTSSVTHNHPEGIKGACATALAIWRFKGGATVEEVKSEITGIYEYNLTQTVDEIRPDYYFDVSAAGSVPQSIICALEATDFEDAIRNAISIGGDSDTIACIAGSIAEARFGVPEEIRANVLRRLPDEFRSILAQFAECVACQRRVREDVYN